MTQIRILSHSQIFYKLYTGMQLGGRVRPQPFSSPLTSQVRKMYFSGRFYRNKSDKILSGRRFCPTRFAQILSKNCILRFVYSGLKLTILVVPRPDFLWLVKLGPNSVKYLTRFGFELLLNGYV